jgi:AraC family transcriptional regulator
MLTLPIKTLPDSRVACMRHVGRYGDAGISRRWQRFEAWCRELGRFEPRPAACDISHDSPGITAPDKYRHATQQRLAGRLTTGRPSNRVAPI